MFKAWDEEGIEKVAYDFFAEQPILGARVYFYHHILHNWPDADCLIILEQVVVGMTAGYSKLLLHEVILPEHGASQFEGSLDLVMMAFNRGMERTRKQWRELLAKAGLQVIQFWKATEEDGDGVVEAMKM
ncbi:sterigmatocystin 8-O-methyltransferase [Aspergillus affinis]|uniref:sterigmatocystin 8-O-methyltransferase n=1 Tax=Aspergillus affinis TaxID=1070780 RepID=UPI0022FE6AB1|nr:sterigmatocystin 8-O-methyltransferase [Aspergillus affinis]KAI9037170.1 sterigmatocystin 8-O-methyltransferase [Aspergillus affinis]